MPGILSPKLDWTLANPLWAQTLNPILTNPVIQGSALNGISLKASTPLTIAHKLGRLQQGVFITPFGNAVVWVAQAFNNKTLTLEASADCVVNLWVY